MITLIGLAAAFCTTVAYLPQVLHTWRTRSTGDLSLPMFLVDDDRSWRCGWSTASSSAMRR